MATAVHTPMRATPGRVTHAEISAAIGRAFGSGAVHRDGLLAVARGAGARTDVLELLCQLPPYRYSELRQVLETLPSQSRG